MTSRGWRSEASCKTKSPCQRGVAESLFFDQPQTSIGSFEIAAKFTTMKRNAMRLLLSVLVAGCFLDSIAAAEPKTLTLERTNHWLIIRGPQLPGEIKINYLEAYCRAGSTDADW